MSEGDTGRGFSFYFYPITFLSSSIAKCQMLSSIESRKN